MNPKEVTYENFLGCAAKFKSERARTALIKNKARQIIKELAPTNTVYYEKIKSKVGANYRARREASKRRCQLF